MKIRNATDFIQSAIIKVLVDDLLAADFYIDVNDREETNLKRSRDPVAIMQAIFDPNVDEDRWTLDLWKNPKARNSDAWVILVEGNGSTVISDYTTNIEEQMKRADALVNTIMADEEAWFGAQIERFLKIETALLNALPYVPGYLDEDVAGRPWITAAVEALKVEG